MSWASHPWSPALTQLVLGSHSQILLRDEGSSGSDWRLDFGVLTVHFVNIFLNFLDTSSESRIHILKPPSIINFDFLNFNLWDGNLIFNFFSLIPQMIELMEKNIPLTEQLFNLNNLMIESI